MASTNVNVSTATPHYEITAEETSGNPSGGLVVAVTIRNFDETPHSAEASLIDDVVALVEALPSVTVLQTSKTTVTSVNL